jgi:hypothetical protein
MNCNKNINEAPDKSPLRDLGVKKVAKEKELMLRGNTRELLKI